MAEGGVIVVDDFHLGVVVYRVRSRLLNAIPGVIGRLLGRSGRGEELVAASEREQRVRDRQAEAFRRQECGRGVRGGAGWPVVARDSHHAFAGRVPGRRLFAGGAQQGDCGAVESHVRLPRSGGVLGPDRIGPAYLIQNSALLQPMRSRACAIRVRCPQRPLIRRHRIPADAQVRTAHPVTFQPMRLHAVSGRASPGCDGLVECSCWSGAV